MANVGADIEYGSSSALIRELLDALQSEYTDLGVTYAVPSLSGAEPFHRRICKKVSATTPGDRAGDYPRAVGDLCIHYDAAGVYQNVYVATAIVHAAAQTMNAVTWTVLAVT